MKPLVAVYGYLSIDRIAVAGSVHEMCPAGRRSTPRSGRGRPGRGP